MSTAYVVKFVYQETRKQEQQSKNKSPTHTHTTHARTHTRTHTHGHTDTHTHSKWIEHALQGAAVTSPVFCFSVNMHQLFMPSIMHADKQTVLWACGPIISDVISTPPTTTPHTQWAHSSCQASFPRPVEHTAATRCHRQTPPPPPNHKHTPTHALNSCKHHLHHIVWSTPCIRILYFIK